MFLFLFHFRPLPHLTFDQFDHDISHAELAVMGDESMTIQAQRKHMGVELCCLAWHVVEVVFILACLKASSPNGLEERVLPWCSENMEKYDLSHVLSILGMEWNEEDQHWFSVAYR